MSTSPCLPITIPAESKEEEANKYKKICKEHNELLETLPKGKGWAVQHIYNYKGFWLNPITMKNNLLLHSFFKTQPSDIILASFPKTGATWLKALIFSIINRNHHHPTNADDHLLHHITPHTAIPFIDFEVDSYPINPDFTNLPEPRLFSTHFPRTLLTPAMASCKIVYICRYPKNVFISKWHFFTKLRSKDLPPLTLDEAFQLFCQGVSEVGPFWEHVLSFWRPSVGSPHKILFFKYEEMRMQPVVEVRKLARFIGKPFTEEEEERGVVEEIVNLCSFQNMSNHYKNLPL